MKPLQLPPPLAPWAALLEIFPTDLARALGPLVQRLDIAIGPLRTRHRIGQGEPDGYDGLSRRGLYERLLVSEWLLAEELPDEFARRAATGEHAFLKLARREPSEARSCVALLDAGPGQLGAPRLAHLAALVVLARRAHLAGARFEWGILQEQPGVLFDEITPTTIERWLQARTVQSLDETMLEGWRECLKITETHDDFWLLGGRDLEGLEAARGASLLLVDDPLEIETRTLQLQLKMTHRTVQHITLELPEEAACARLLRDPFGAVSMNEREWRQVSQGCAAQSNLIFADATRLLARSREGLVVYHIPRSTKGGIPRPKRYQVDVENLVAAGLYGKAVMAVTKHRDDFYLLCLNQQKSPFNFGPYQPYHGIADSLLNKSQLAPLFFVQGKGTVPVLWLPQAKDQCLLRLDPEAKKAMPIAFLVSRVAQLSTHNLTYAVESEKECKIIYFSVPDKFAETQVISGVQSVYFYADSARGAGLTVAARSGELEQQNALWKMLFEDQEMNSIPPPTAQIVGLLHLPTWPTPGLIRLADDRRSIAVWRGANKGFTWHHVLRASETIEQITVCPTAPRIAYATEHEVAVYCLEKETHLLRVRWEES